MSDVLKFTILGLGSGGLYTLAAIGLVLVYRGSGVVNFAQAAMGLVGAYAYYEARVERGLAWPLALAFGLTVSAAVGALFYALVMRRMRESSVLARTVATLALLVVLQSATQLVYGQYPKLTPSIVPNGRVEILGVSVGEDRVWIFAIAVALTTALSLLYRFTAFGVATTAVAENPRAAAALAVSPHTIALANWAVGSALAGLAVMLLVPITGLHSSNITMIIIPVLASAIVGKLSSFPITMAAALAIGVSQSLVTRFVDTPGLLTAIPFLLVSVVLLARGRAVAGKDETFPRLPVLGSGRPAPVLVLAAVAVSMLLVWVLLPATWIDPFMVQVLLAIVLLSVVVVTGYAGQLSLASMAFASIGAGGTSYFMSRQGWSFQSAVLGGMVVTIPVGALIGVIGTRLRGLSLAVVTLGFGITVEAMVFGNRSITRRFMSFRGDELLLFGIDVGAPKHPERYATVAVVVFAIVGICIANLRRGRAGRRLIAVRNNERAAAALGISVIGAKLYAFVLGGVIAGLGGALLAYRAPFLRFGDFNFFRSILAVQYAVLGGVGSIPGPLVGSSFYTEAMGPKVFAFVGSNVALTLSLVGNLALLLMLTIAPDGVTSLMGGLFRRLAGFTGFRTDKPASQARTTTETTDGSARRSASTGHTTVRPVSLELHDVRVEFGGTVALDGLTMCVEPGEVVGLIGPNGAGKTTAIEAITGFVTPARGTVRLGAESITHWGRERRARAGLSRSFQSLELFDDLTVRENLQTACDSRDFLAYLTDLVRPGRPRFTSSALAAVEDFKLEHYLDAKVGELGYATRRMVAVARAVAGGQSVLLLDEPAAGLDAAQARHLGEIVRRLATQRGIAVLLVEHNVEVVLRTCDRIYALDFGRLIGAGSPAEIRADPAVVGAYLGASV